MNSQYRIKILFYTLFFVSGLSALLYEIAWIRQFEYIFGYTIYSISAIVTAFMAGLGIGGYIFGRLTDKYGLSLRTYAIMELVIGLYASLLVFIIPSFSVLYKYIEHLWPISFTSFSFIKLFLSFAILTPATTLMGGTLPVLVKNFTESPEVIGRSVGRLYGLNTLGAVLGPLLTGFVLIPRLGISHTIFLGALLNLAVAGLAAWASLNIQTGREIEREKPPKKSAGRITESFLPFFIVTFSGFGTLSCQILWTRIFASLLSSNVLVYCVILASFLLGLSLGSLIISSFIDRMREPWFTVGMLLLCGGVAVILIPLFIPAIGTIVNELFKWRQASGIISELRYFPIFLLLGSVLIVPATVLGMIFPAVVKAGIGSLESLGEELGKLYSLNTLGAILGSLVSGFFLIGSLGTYPSLFIIGALYGLSGLLIFMKYKHRTMGVISVILALLLLIGASLRKPIYWFNAGFNRAMRIEKEMKVHFREGISSDVGVMEKWGIRSLTIDGIVVAQNTRRDLWDLMFKAHLPMLFHPDPEDVLLIGLGGGISLGVVEQYGATKRIDCVELAPETEETLKYFERENDRCWEDPRLNLIFNDGRHFLSVTERRYDVISVDPTDPPISTLYTRDFFELCANALKDGGIMVHWVPLFRLNDYHIRMILKSFHTAFPHTSIWYDGSSILLFGRRNRRLTVDCNIVGERLKDPKVNRSLRKVGADNMDLLLSTFIMDEDRLKELIGEDVQENTDDRPFLEYTVLGSARFPFGNNIERIYMLREKIDKVIEKGSSSEEEMLGIRRYHRLVGELADVRVKMLRGKTTIAREQLTEISRRYDLSQREISILTPFWGR